MTASDRQVDGWIEDMVGALFYPIIVMPGGWWDDLLEWLRTRITLERLVKNMKVLKGEIMTGTSTDTEACAYLFLNLLNVLSLLLIQVNTLTPQLY